MSEVLLTTSPDKKKKEAAAAAASNEQYQRSDDDDDDDHVMRAVAAAAQHHAYNPYAVGGYYYQGQQPNTTKKRPRHDEDDGGSSSQSDHGMTNNLHVDDNTTKEKGPKKWRRPYTEYNLFFKLERELLLKKADYNAYPNQNGGSKEANPTEDPPPPLPLRYKHLSLPTNWYLPDDEHKPRRKHRKTHGTIGFVELGRMISQKWKALDEDDECKQFCRELAARGRAEYNKIHQKQSIQQQPPVDAQQLIVQQRKWKREDMLSAMPDKEEARRQAVDRFDRQFQERLRNAEEAAAAARRTASAKAAAAAAAETKDRASSDPEKQTSAALARAYDAGSDGRTQEPAEERSSTRQTDEEQRREAEFHRGRAERLRHEAARTREAEQDKQLWQEQFQQAREERRRQEAERLLQAEQEPIISARRMPDEPYVHPQQQQQQQQQEEEAAKEEDAAKARSNDRLTQEAEERSRQQVEQNQIQPDETEPAQVGQEKEGAEVDDEEARRVAWWQQFQQARTARLRQEAMRKRQKKEEENARRFARWQQHNLQWQRRHAERQPGAVEAVWQWLDAVERKTGPASAATSST